MKNEKSTRESVIQGYYGGGPLQRAWSKPHPLFQRHALKLSQMKRLSFGEVRRMILCVSVEGTSLKTNLVMIGVNFIVLLH